MSDEQDFCTCGHWRRDHEDGEDCHVESIVEGEPWYCPCTNFEIELREEPSKPVCSYCACPIDPCLERKSGWKHKMPWNPAAGDWRCGGNANPAKQGDLLQEPTEEPSNLWDTCTACELPLPSCTCNVDPAAVNEGMATGDAAASAYKLVLEQAEDEGLWFVPQYITEDYLQRALRALHAAVEADVAKPSLSSEMGELRQLVREYYDKHFCMDDDALVPERCKLCIKADALLPKESL